MRSTSLFYFATLPALKPPRITVIVLNWNGAADTLRCLASLKAMAQPLPDILVVDNHSGDDSVAQILRVHPALTILQTGANLGFGGGCNAGIRHALTQGADYIWLLNNDTLVEADTLSAMVQTMAQHHTAGAVGSVIYDMDVPTRVQVWGGGLVQRWLGRARPLRGPGEPAFISGASMLLRVDALRQVGLFDEQRFFMYWEDTDLGFRLRARGWTLAVAPQSRVWHRLSASLGQGSAQLDAYFMRSAVRFLRLHAPCPPLAITSLASTLLLKRILLGHWHRVRAVWQGLRSA